MNKEKLSSEDYEKLKIFMGFFFDLYKSNPGIKPEHHPLAVMERMIIEHSSANIRRALEMTINDMIEDSAAWHPEQVAEADVKFAAAGTFTLTEVRRRYSKKYLQLLKRGVIRKETEYYLLKGILDGGGMEPGATESQQIQTMLLAFEAEVMKRLPK